MNFDGTKMEFTRVHVVTYAGLALLLVLFCGVMVLLHQVIGRDAFMFALGMFVHRLLSGLWKTL